MIAIIFLTILSAIVATIAFVSLAFLEVAFRTPDISLTATAELLDAADVRSASRLWMGGLKDGAQRCSGCPQRMIGVTPPEVLLVADLIIQTQPSGTTKRVCDLAAANARRVEKLNREQYTAGKITCPLHVKGNTCLAYAARPLQCREWNQEPETGGKKSATQSARPEQAIARGLTAAGVEGGLYEFNSALATALKSSDAARRWASGQPVFANCNQYG